MPTPGFLHLSLAFAAAFLAGAINSVAGGGTMISFPVLIALGLPPVVANATSTVGIWPGSLGSLWGFRRELGALPRRMRWFVIPAFGGGAVGAILLRVTPPGLFEHLVPWLLLFATLLFMARGAVQRHLRSAETGPQAGGDWFVFALCAQFAVAVYGGYFGAGMSIMMLSVLGVMGLTNILEMNALTSLLSLVVNGVAGVLFARGGLIAWPFVGVMAAGAVLGGYGAAGVARRISKQAVQRFVIGVGLTISLVMFVRVLSGR